MIETLFLCLALAGVVGALIYGLPAGAEAMYRWDVIEAKAREAAQQPQTETPPPEPCQEEGVSRWDLLKGD